MNILAAFYTINLNENVLGNSIPHIIPFFKLISDVIVKNKMYTYDFDKMASRLNHLTLPLHICLHF